jgi:hypothetical protein
VPLPDVVAALPLAPVDETASTPAAGTGGSAAKP